MQVKVVVGAFAGLQKAPLTPLRDVMMDVGLLIAHAAPTLLYALGLMSVYQRHNIIARECLPSPLAESKVLRCEHDTLHVLKT